MEAWASIKYAWFITKNLERKVLVKYGVFVVETKNLIGLNFWQSKSKDLDSTDLQA